MGSRIQQFRAGRGVLLLIAAAATVLGGGFLASSMLSRGRSQTPVTPLARVLQAQKQLPPEALKALQDLRVFGAVQAAWFPSHGRYGTPEQLQAAGSLDARWPRAAADAYRIACTASQARFECRAEPLRPGLPFFRIDPTQAVRWAKNRRPDESSPLFGIVQEVR